MARCRRCGKEILTWGGICRACVKKWHDKRVAAFEQAEAEIGPLTSETYGRIKKRVREIEEDSK